MAGGMIGLVLLGYGVLGMVANVIAGPWAARLPGRTAAVIVGVLGATLALFPLLGASPWGGAALLLVWGLAYGGAPVTLQTWVLGGARICRGGDRDLLLRFNLAIAFGALASSLLVDAAGVRTVFWLGAVLVLPVLLTVRRAPRLT